MILIAKRKVIGGLEVGQTTEPKYIIEQIEKATTKNATLTSKQLALKWAIIFRS